MRVNNEAYGRLSLTNYPHSARLGILPPHLLRVFYNVTGLRVLILFILSLTNYPHSARLSIIPPPLLRVLYYVTGLRDLIIFIY